MFNFEKLDVRHKAIDFADFIYSVTGTFPETERFGLTSQMRRAAVSIASNLAEGSSRSSRTDFARFIELASGSVYEVVSQAMIGRRQAFLSEENYLRLHKACEEQSKMLRVSADPCWKIVSTMDSFNFNPSTLISQPSSAFGSAYGNRTRLSALRGPCPNR